MKLLTTIALTIFSLNSLAGSYEDKFPEYFEYCSASQLKYQDAYFDGGTGGKGGHGFVYLHGLCKDTTKNYPQVVPCDSSHDHKGVGISLDSDYKNVPWIAVPGRNLFFFGDVDPSTSITENEISSVVNKATKLKVFENVTFHNEFVSKHEVNTTEHLRASTIASLGTDIAINWARELRCIKIPVTKPAIVKAAKFLNDFSNSYYQQQKEYKWDFLYNNCTHLSMNIGHAMGLNRFMKYDQKLLPQLNHVAVPANAYLYYVDLAFKKDNKSIKSMLQNKYFKKTFHDFGYLPAQAGTMISLYPAFESSVIFRTEDVKSVTLPRRSLTNPFATLNSYDKYFTAEKNSDLESNFNFWREKYASSLEKVDEESPIQKYLKKQLSLVKD